MANAVSVTNCHGNHWHLVPKGRQRRIGEACLLQSQNTPFLHPGDVTAVPHHTRMVGVLRQDATNQNPGLGRNALRQLLIHHSDCP